MKSKVLVFILLFLVACFTFGCSQANNSSGSSGSTDNDTTNDAVSSLTSLVISPSSVTLEVGSTQQFTATAYYSSQSTMKSVSPTWEVIGSIGTIDATGLFTATKEGTGTIEARYGENTTTLSSVEVLPIMTTGYVYDILLGQSLPISGATVVADNYFASSGSSGNYKIVSTSNQISSFHNGYLATTISSSNPTVNIPLYEVDYPNSFTYSKVSAHVVDSDGKPMEDAEVTVSIRATNKGYEYSCSSGYSALPNSSIDFQANLGIPDDETSASGYISVVYRIGTQWKGYIEQISLAKGVDLNIGNIVVSEKAASITGNLDAPFISSGYKSVELGIKKANGYGYSLASNCEILQGNKQYQLYAPASLVGEDYCVVGYVSQSGIGISVKHIENKNISVGSTITQDMSFMEPVMLSNPINSAEVSGVAPTLQWKKLSKDCIYFVILLSSSDDRQIFLTEDNKITVPKFTSSSNGEKYNLVNGGTYRWSVVSFSKYPGLDINNLDFNKLSLAVDSTNPTEYQSFKVSGSTALSNKSVENNSTRTFGNIIKRLRMFNSNRNNSFN